MCCFAIAHQIAVLLFWTSIPTWRFRFLSLLIVVILERMTILIPIRTDLSKVSDSTGGAQYCKQTTKCVCGNGIIRIIRVNLPLTVFVASCSIDNSIHAPLFYEVKELRVDGWHE